MSKRAPICVWVAGWLLVGATCGAQAPVRIGTLSGGDFRLRGEIEVAADGKTVLLSGARLELQGVARLAFAGGEARLCGPLKMTVLKSGAESGDPDDLPLLFALDSGALEIDYTGAATHAIQTAFFSISTVPSGKQERKLAVRVAASGEACIAALAGSLRVREQLGAAELMIPPGRALRVPAAGIEKAEAAAPADCGCAPPANPTVAPASPPAGPPGVRSQTTIATAPLVYNADEAASLAKPTREPEVTLPVVRSAPPPEPSAEAQPPAAKRTPSAQAPPTAARRSTGLRAVGSRIKGFFRTVLGLKKPAEA